MTAIFLVYWTLKVTLIVIHGKLGKYWVSCLRLLCILRIVHIKAQIKATFWWLGSLCSTHISVTSVWVKVFFSLSCTLLYVVFQIFKKKNFSREIENNFPQKIQILPRNFLVWFGHKEIERLRFWKSNMKNCLKLIFVKECGFWSWKGSNKWTLF